jgi:hypothetical protein
MLLDLVESNLDSYVWPSLLYFGRLDVIFDSGDSFPLERYFYRNVWMLR